MKNILFIAVLCFLITACQSSPKKNYFYLTPDAKSISQNSGEITQLIGIGPVEIAEYLSRSQIIDNQTDNTLNMAENAYWAEPLDKNITRVISLNLTQLNSSRSFVSFPWRSDSKPRYSLRVRIDNLARNQAKAIINATWELVDNDTKNNLIRRNFIHSATATSGAKGLAQAYSELLAKLAEEMDIELKKLQQ